MGLGAGVDPGAELTRWGLRLALAVVVLGIVGAACCGCPRPRDCTPREQRCEGDTPVICNAESRSWRASGDPVVTCAEIGGVCVVTAGIAHCDRRDGGAR